ncbi:hypothetical protein I7I51_05586 [Histoplasma capsulatum]|uniref:Uncharacterized protein n=1 Tax=Ajellomyces capsulatus TaxID=5037 RepID=A0A8A1M7T0_AJECA|nr:hypothetical protein I7I51_05586 [Histoplasma capsulatum]
MSDNITHTKFITNHDRMVTSGNIIVQALNFFHKLVLDSAGFHGCLKVSRGRQRAINLHLNRDLWDNSNRSDIQQAGREAGREVGREEQIFRNYSYTVDAWVISVDEDN